MAVAEVTNYVNPLIGTDFTGNTYPGAQVPFGMVQLSPDNGLPGWDRIAGYFYPDSTISGFSHTHLSGTGAGDLYDISFLPVTLPAREAEAPLGIHSRFSHDDETVKAGYYQVRLADYDIDVELTATERCGVQRYTFPGGPAAVILNLEKATNWDVTTDCGVSVTDSCTITGHRFSGGWAPDEKLWFRTQFSEPWDSVKIDGGIAWFYYNTTPGRQLTLTTELSCTGADFADFAPLDFDATSRQAAATWEKALAVIRVEGDNEDDKVKFYTALYHAMLAPTIYCDAEGSYRGPDGKIHKADGWTNYGTFSLWDTYRASHPLLTIIDPYRARDFAISLLTFGEQNGRLPVWNFQGCETDMMIGYHSAPVIIDAILKNLMPDSLSRRALNLCVTTADKFSNQLGYVAYDQGENWSMSKTLEYAFDDHCISLLAEHLGEERIAADFRHRAQRYRNVFNPATQFFQPRDSKGEFMPDFDPQDYSEPICESNAWQYLWSVQHDIEGLIELLGGEERFAERLDSMMTLSPATDLPIFSTGMIGQYAQGNEPSHHVIYLFNRVGRNDLTRKYAKQVMDELYGTGPDGLCGNDDCGQLSAWFVFSAMGFYPVDPVSGIYELGEPLFKKVEIDLPNGKTFTVERKGPATDAAQIYSGTQITHTQILNGEHIIF